MFQAITNSVSGGSVRTESFDGRDHLVVPMVMMRPGVLAGSNGPLLYNADEISKTPQVWDHKPVVVYHPTINGQGVSACSPQILTSRKIGVILNTRWDSESQALKAEAFIDPEKVKIVDNRVWDAIQNKRVMELSTGLFVDTRSENGEWNGRKYTDVTANYRPDHLAVLPDQVGACSIADGAGFCRNSDGTDRRITTNAAMSHSDLSSRLYELIAEKYGNAGAINTPSDTWIQEVYDTYTVFNRGTRLYKVDYTVDGNVVKLSGDVMEVRRTVSYEPVTATTNSENKGERTVRNDVINNLIKGGYYGETDRDRLTAMDDATFNRVSKILNNSDTPAPAPAESTTTIPPGDAAFAPAPAVNAAAPRTTEEYLATLPATVRNMVEIGLNQYASNRQRLISEIVGLPDSGWTAEALTSLDDPTLNRIHGMATKLAAAPAVNPAVQNYLGAVGAAPFAVNAAGMLPTNVTVPAPLPSTPFVPAK